MAISAVSPWQKHLGELSKSLAHRRGFLKDVSLGRVWTPEEAKAEFDIDIKPGYTVKVEPYAVAESGYGFTLLTPEGWQIKPDETYISPTGQSFTKQEMEEQRELAVRREDIIKRLGPYKGPEGRYDVQSAREVLSDEELALVFEEEALVPPSPPVPSESSLTAMLQSLYPESFLPTAGYTEEELPQMVVEGIAAQMKDDPTAFLVDLYDRATIEEVEEFLGVLGITPTEITSITAKFTEIDKQNELIQAVFPDMDIEDFSTMLETDLVGFLDVMQTGGMTKEKLDLLHRGMGIPFQSDTELDIQDIFSRVKLVVPIDGDEQLVTITPDGKAYNEEGHWVGTYNRATKQFNAAKTDEGWFKDNIIDPWNMAANRLGHSLSQFGSGVLANILYPEMPEWYPAPLRDFMNETNKEMRDGFRIVHALNQKDFDDWIVKHPELIPKPEYEEGWSAHPELLLDLGYMAYEFSSTAPISIGVMTIMVGGFVTGNIPLGLMGGMAVMTPAESADAYEALLDAGAPEDEAASWGLFIGTCAGLIETLSDLFVVKVIAAPLAGLLRKEVVKAAAKVTVRHLVKKGVFTFTTVEAIEISEEELTLAISNAVLKIYDENKEIWDDMVRTAAKTFAAVAPIAVAGGSATMIGISRQQSTQFTGAEKIKQGWKQDTVSKEWFRPMTKEEIVAKLEEGGIISKLTLPVSKALSEAAAEARARPEKGAITPFPKEVPALTDALINEGADIVTKAEAIAPTNASVIEFRKLVNQAKEATIPEARLEALRGMEALENEVRTIAKVPKAEVGMPEAGYQPAMFEEALDREVRPRGKGELVQISMEDQLKLEQARRAVEEVAPAERGAYEAQAEIEGLKVTHELDPVTQWTTEEKVTRKTKQPDGTYKLTSYTRRVGLDSFISIREQSFPEYFTLEQAQAIKPHINITPYSQKGTPLYNKVPRADVLDELADKWNMTIDEVAERVMVIRAEKARIKQLERVEAVETVEEVRVEETIRGQLEDIQKIVEFWRNKIKTLEETKASLAKYVRQNLPISIRGKFITSVARIKTDLQLQRQMVKVQEVAELNAQKVLRAEIRKVIKKARAKIKEHILKGKFTPEVQRRLDVLDHNLNLDRDTARDKMSENMVKYDNGELTYEEMLEANEALNFTGIEGMSAEELANTLDYIKVLRDVGRSERQAKQEVATERIKAIRVDISNILTGGKGLKAGIGAVPRGELAAKPGWLDTFTNWQYGIDSLADKLSKLDPTSKPFQSTINKFVAQVHRATNRQVIGTKEAYNKVKDTFADVYKVKGTHDINQVLNGLEEEVNLGTFELTEEYKANHPEATTVNIKMTRDEMLVKYMQLQQARLQDTFRITMGWSERVGQAISDTLTEQEKSLTEAMFDYYADEYAPINEVYTEIYNVDMPHDPRYIQHFRDLEGGVTENVLVFQDAHRYAGVSAQSIKARQQNLRPLKFIGLTKLLSNHIEQMEHFKAWATTMRDMRRVFGNEEIRQAIEQYHGRGISKLIDTFMSQMARGGIESAATNRAADYLRRAFTKSILAVKPVIMLKQIPSLFAYISEMNTVDFFGGIIDFWKSPVANFKFLYNNSEMFRARMSVGFERDIRAAMEKHGKAALSGKGKFTDWFLLQIRVGDTFAVTQGMWAKYKAGLKQGLSQGEAIAAAEDTTGRTQPSFGIDTLSAIQNGGSWLKLMTMFQNQPNKYFRIVGDNLRNFKYGRGSRAKAASTILLAWVILPMMFQFIADAFQWKPERQLRAGLLGPLNFILIGGQLVQSAWGWLTDQPFDYQISPVAQTGRDLQMIFLKAKKLVTQGLDPYKDISGDDVAALIEYLAKAGGQVTGLPTPYLVQVSKGIRTKLREDEAINIKDFLFSQWALEPPKKNAEEKVEEATLKLGEIEEGQEDKPLTEKELKIYDTTDWFREIGGDIYNKVLPQDVLDNPHTSKESKAWAEYEIARSKADILPNIPLYKINTEDNDDTIINYYQQWKAREKIDNLPDLIEFDKLYPKANLGNISRQQYNLLVKYLETSDEKKKQFVEDHPGLKINPRNEWLKDTENARGAALLALGGDAKLLSIEAYNEFNKLVKELDIPNDAIPEQTLPPEGSVENYFKYQGVLEQPGMAWNSWESEIIWGQDEALRDFLGYDPLDTPIAALEIKTGKTYRDIWHKLNTEDYPDYIGNLDDKVQDENGLTERDRARAELMGTVITGDMTFRDTERQIKAIEKGNETNPIPDEIVDAHVAFMRIGDQTGIKFQEAEAMLFRVDNPSYNESRLDQDLWGDDYLKEDVDLTQVPKWRLQVQYRNEWTKYDVDIPKKYDDISDAEISVIAAPEGINTDWWARQDVQAKRKRLIAMERDTMLADNETLRRDFRKVDAYEDKCPEDMIDLYVGYYELYGKGQEDERFLVENGGQDPNNLTGFAKWMHEVKGVAIPRPEDVPDAMFDIITKQFQDQFDELENLADHTSVYYIEDATARKARAKALRFSGGRYTEFGLAELRRNAYKLMVPKEQVDNYVEFNRIKGEGKPRGYPQALAYWEDSWFMLEHLDFHNNIWVKLLGNQPYPTTIRTNEDGIEYLVNKGGEVSQTPPTREIGAKYITYKKLETQIEREQFRIDNPDLDEWGVAVGIWSGTMTEKRKQLGLTEEEKARKAREERDKKFWEKMEGYR